MEYEEIKEWLDFWVDSIEEQRKHVLFNSHIRTHDLDDFIFVSDIEQVADIMGIKLIEEICPEYVFKYKYSFTYRGLGFINTYKSRLPQFEEEDKRDVPV